MSKISMMAMLEKLERRIRHEADRQAAPSRLEAPGIDGLLLQLGSLGHPAKIKSTKTVGRDCSVESRANETAP